jgi:enediyne biosynthesis protein E4
MLQLHHFSMARDCGFVRPMWFCAGIWPLRSAWTRLAVILCLIILPGCDKRAEIANPESVGRSDSPLGVSSNDPAVIRAKNSTGQSPAAGPPRFRFRDVTEASGCRWRYRNGEESGHFAIVESLGGGVAAIDYDRDGDEDLCFSGGGQFDGPQSLRGLPPGLFRQNGELEFEEVSLVAGLDRPGHYSHGVFAADADNDGFVDVLLTGYGGLQLYRNQGDGTFREQSAPAGLTDSSWSSAAAWADVNGDSVLDLYVAHYVDWSFDNHPFCEALPPAVREVCPPRRFEPLPDLLYQGAGDGSFVDHSRAAGLRTDGKGLGVLICDLDLDGDCDVYVANDTVENFLYENIGNGLLRDQSLVSGAALSDRGVPDGSMGLDICDYNSDGLPDLFVANYESENCALYENQGQLLFRHVSQRTGITASGSMYVSWGTLANDLDLDGDEDVLVLNSHVLRFPENSTLRQPALLYENLGNGRLLDCAAKVGGPFLEPGLSRGLTGVDFDSDGDFDAVAVPLNDPILILQNEVMEQSSSAEPIHWVQIDLVGTRSTRDPVGARVTVETKQSRQVRQYRGGGSYASTHSRRLHWGLGATDVITRMEVVWPGGIKQEFTEVPIDHVLIVIEGRPDLIPLKTTPPKPRRNQSQWAPSQESYLAERDR